MKKQLLMTALLGAMTLPAWAEGIYIFGDIERNKLEAKFEGMSDSETKTGFGFGLGYQFNPNFGVELAYRDLLSLSDSYSEPGYSASIKTDLSALQVSVLGSYPLTDVFSLYGRLGVGKVDLDVSAYENDGGIVSRASGSESKTKAMFGLGARWAVAESVGLRAEYSRYAKIEDLTLSTLSVGIDYHF